MGKSEIRNSKSVRETKDALMFLSVSNGKAFSPADIPDLDPAAFKAAVCEKAASGLHLSALFCRPGASGNRLIAVLADGRNGRLLVTACTVGKEFPSLTPECPQAQLFEREIFEIHGIRPEGHPWLKPVRFPGNSRHPRKEIGDGDFFSVTGDEIHEVAVGPVHAGVIEPGHFRFQCQGEIVHHLEISLGYQHRGIETAFRNVPPLRRIHFIETAAGDTTAGHATAYCGALEALSGCRVPARAQAIRGIALELERIACHIGDLGALAGDVGFLPTAAYCGRIRGNVLNLTADLCGNRFSRRLIRPGGVAFDLDGKTVAVLLSKLVKIREDAKSAIELLWRSPSVMARFEGTGKVYRKTALEIGLVGPAARACGIERDVRGDHPFGIYAYHQVPPSVAESGDVFARAMVRWLETTRSFTFVEEMLKALPVSDSQSESGPLHPEKMVVSLVEGWRGEICHVAATGSDGEISDYKIVDPSFHNWFGLACALRNEQISDFPLCNKSFNLSYCGFDL